MDKYNNQEHLYIVATGEKIIKDKFIEVCAR